MKSYESYMIYNSPFPSSIKAMETSIKKSGDLLKQWNLSTFDGCNPANLKEYEKKWPLKPKEHFKKMSTQLPVTVKCVFYSHFEMWHKAIERHKIIIVLEHDFYCNQAIDDNILNGNYDFLHLGLYEGMIKEFFTNNRLREFKKKKDGIHPLPVFCHPYYRVPMFRGMGCYAVTPKGAEKAVENAYVDGWESADDFVNETLGNCRYISPHYAEQSVENPNTTEFMHVSKYQKIQKLREYVAKEKYCLLDADEKYLSKKERIDRILHLLLLRYPYVGLRFFYRFFKRKPHRVHIEKNIKCRRRGVFKTIFLEKIK